MIDIILPNMNGFVFVWMVLFVSLHNVF
jgi:hypothetical protein